MSLEFPEGFEVLIYFIKEDELIMSSNSKDGALGVESNLRNCLDSVFSHTFQLKSRCLNNSELSTLIPNCEKLAIGGEFQAVSCTIQSGILYLPSCLNIPNCKHFLLSHCVKMLLVWMHCQPPEFSRRVRSQMNLALVTEMLNDLSTSCAYQNFSPCLVLTH